MSGGRTPEEVLADFGRDLRRAQVPRRRRWRRVLAIAAVLLAGGGATAAATSSLWAPSPRVSVTARPQGAPVPDAASRPVYVASGRDWRLSASACRFGGRTTVAVFLTTATSGAGWRCNALSPAVARGVVPPPTLLVEPGLLFGAAPPATTHVDALVLDIATRKTRLQRITARAVDDPRTAVYVARLRGDVRLITVVGTDADGHPTMRCDQELCR
ncbi:hypothetical protein [Solirubrobacter soli]|uniref:hypothetical protein n=1 Tax=Solirubrobacter soli TaxID=363832 RepID=UPI00041752FB|nr:hypothetical protein [Solirubrobacter soli]